PPASPPSSPPVLARRSYSAVASSPQPGSASPVTTSPRRKNPTAPSDPRIMIRLNDDSPARAATAARNFAAAKFALGNAAPALKAVQYIPTGIALIPTNSTGRSSILAAADKVQRAFNARAVEEQTGREDFMIPYAPLTLA